jgi:hypothetical protein
MKLSRILQSQTVIPNGYHDGGGSWGIYLSPEQPDQVIKLFFNEQQFNDERTGYDRVLDDPCLMRYANQYSVIAVQLDAFTYPNNRSDPPFEYALIMPFLSSPPWEEIGKLVVDQGVDEKLMRIGVNVNDLKDNFIRIGVASWEVTFFVHSNFRDIKAIDFTYSENILDSNTDTEE